MYVMSLLGSGKALELFETASLVGANGTHFGWGSDLLRWATTRRQVRLAASRSCKQLPIVLLQIICGVEAR